MKQNIVLRLLILSFLVSPFVEICNGYSGNIPKITRTRGTDEDINGEDNDIDGEEPEVLDGGFSGHIPRITRTRPTVNEDEFEVLDEDIEDDVFVDEVEEQCDYINSDTSDFKIELIPGDKQNSQLNVCKEMPV